jgi:hypothetical protein
MSDSRVDEIEDMIARGELNAAQVFTQMRQLVQTRAKSDGGELPRYGIEWVGPRKPIAVPMDDGYWTPWHLANQELSAASAVVQEERGTNRYGLDMSYFRRLFNRELSNLENFMPDELARVLARAARTADASVLQEGEFQSSAVVPGILYDGFKVFSEVQRVRELRGLEKIKNAVVVSDVLDAIFHLLKQDQNHE